MSEVGLQRNSRVRSSNVQVHKPRCLQSEADLVLPSITLTGFLLLPQEDNQLETSNDSLRSHLAQEIGSYSISQKDEADSRNQRSKARLWSRELSRTDVEELLDDFDEDTTEDASWASLPLDERTSKETLFLSRHLNHENIITSEGQETSAEQDWMDKDNTRNSEGYQELEFSINDRRTVFSNGNATDACCPPSLPDVDCVHVAVIPDANHCMETRACFFEDPNTDIEEELAPGTCKYKGNGNRNSVRIKQAVNCPSEFHQDCCPNPEVFSDKEFNRILQPLSSSVFDGSPSESGKCSATGFQALQLAIILKNLGKLSQRLPNDQPNAPIVSLKETNVSHHENMNNFTSPATSVPESKHTFGDASNRKSCKDIIASQQDAAGCVESSGPLVKPAEGSFCVGGAMSGKLDDLCMQDPCSAQTCSTEKHGFCSQEESESSSERKGGCCCLLEKNDKLSGDRNTSCSEEKDHASFDKKDKPVLGKKNSSCPEHVNNKSTGENNERSSYSNDQEKEDTSEKDNILFSEREDLLTERPQLEISPQSSSVLYTTSEDNGVLDQGDHSKGPEPQPPETPEESVIGCQTMIQESRSANGCAHPNICERPQPNFESNMSDASCTNILEKDGTRDPKDDVISNEKDHLQTPPVRVDTAADADDHQLELEHVEDQRSRRNLLFRRLDSGKLKRDMRKLCAYTCYSSSSQGTDSSTSQGTECTLSSDHNDFAGETSQHEASEAHPKYRPLEHRGHRLGRKLPKIPDRVPSCQKIILEKSQMGCTTDEELTAASTVPETDCNNNIEGEGHSDCDGAGLSATNLEVQTLEQNKCKKDIEGLSMKAEPGKAPIKFSSSESPTLPGTSRKAMDPLVESLPNKHCMPGVDQQDMNSTRSKAQERFWVSWKGRGQQHQFSPSTEKSRLTSMTEEPQDFNHPGWDVGTQCLRLDWIVQSYGYGEEACGSKTDGVESSVHPNQVKR